MYAQKCLRLRHSNTRRMYVDKGPCLNLERYLRWIHQHVRLLEVFANM